MTERFWHKAPKGMVHERVFGHVCHVHENQMDIDRKNRDLAMFYSNRQEPGIHGGTRGVHRSPWSGVTENVIASVIDTATSLIAKSKPRVAILTDNAEWSRQQDAKRIEKYIGGLFESLRVYETMQTMFRDACIFGTGLVHAFINKGEIRVERVLPSEMIIDEDTVRSGCKPLEMHRVRLVSKAVLAHRFPKHAADIERSGIGSFRFQHTESQRNDLDQVMVLESWRLPLAGDGRYTMVTENATLQDTAWTHPWFPFVIYKWSKPLTGFYGQGLAEYLLPFQVRIDELNDFIHKCQDLIAVPRVFVEAGSRLLKMQLDNEIGRVIPYVGTPPQFFTPQALTAEIYQYKEQLKRSAFEFAGISKMAAQATRPEGIEAAVALRELSDNQSQRFSIQQGRYEQAHIELGELITNLARQMGKKAPSVYLAKRFVETIDWPNVDMDKNRFVFSLQPSSILGETPAGRLQRIVELAQYGIPIQPNVMQRLLAHPDIQLEDNRTTSALEHAEWVVEQLGKGEYVAPDAFMDLTLTLDRVISALLDAIRLGAPEDVTESMRQWVEEAQILMQPPPGLPLPAEGELPAEGNIADTGLPGVLDPTRVDTGETIAPGLLPESLIT